MQQADLALSRKELTNSLRERLSQLREFFIGKNVTIFVPHFGTHNRYKPTIETIEELIQELVNMGVKPSVCYDMRTHSYLDDLEDMSVPLVDLGSKRFVKTSGGSQTDDDDAKAEINASMPVLGHVYINEHLYDSDIIIPVVSAHVSNSFMIGGVTTGFLSAVPTETRTRIFLNSRAKKESAALVEVFAQLRHKIPFAIMDFNLVDTLARNRQESPLKLKNATLVASDAVACDSIASRFFGWPLALPRVIREAIEYRQGDGLLTMHEDFKNRYNLGVKRPITDRNLLLFPFSHLCRFKLVIDANKCTRCHDCVAACPSGVIKIDKDEKKIDNRKCIKCFICADVCSSSAINIRRTP